MRYDTAICFVKKGVPVYDPLTGDYSDGEPTEETVYASVTDTSKDTLLIVYGEIRQGSLTIRLQNHFDGVFDNIVIKDGRYAGTYAVDKRRKLRVKETFIVSEVQ